MVERTEFEKDGLKLKFGFVFIVLFLRKINKEMNDKMLLNINNHC